jgi:hypothetical protein
MFETKINVFTIKFFVSVLFITIDELIRYPNVRIFTEYLNLPQHYNNKLLKFD